MKQTAKRHANETQAVLNLGQRASNSPCPCQTVDHKCMHARPEYQNEARGTGRHRNPNNETKRTGRCYNAKPRGGNASGRWYR